MQPLRFIQCAIPNPQTEAAHFYFWPTKLKFRKLRNPGKPRIALTDYRAKITARRNISE
jgi:hypothetical protein